MKRLILIIFLFSLSYSQDIDYQFKIDSLKNLLKQTEEAVKALNKELKSNENEISKIKREISGFKTAIYRKSVGGFDEGYKLKPTKSGYIMYGEKEPDRFDFVKFSTSDELTIFRDMIELRNVRWYKAMHEGKLGWINRPNIVNDEYKIPFFHDLGVDSSDVKFPNKRNSTQSLDDISENARISKINRSASRFKSQLRRRQVAIGMTLDEVQMAIGYPKDTNKTTFTFGTRTQLVYGGKFGYDFIYLDDGIVTAIQQ